MTHPMNSNPWPAAFVNFKASIQLFPVSMPGGHTFLEWRMELLTEQHAAAHMTQAMNDIMVVGLSSKQCKRAFWPSQLILHELITSAAVAYLYVLAIARPLASCSSPHFFVAISSAQRAEVQIQMAVVHAEYCDIAMPIYICSSSCSCSCSCHA